MSTGLSSSANLPFDVPADLHRAWTKHPEIVKVGDPVLEKVAKPIIRFTADTNRMIDRMVAIMRKAHGLGLAAPQIGESVRVIVYDAGDGVRILVNPKIVSSKGEQLEPAEGCLSIPGLQGKVLRAAEVRVKAYDQRGRPITRRAVDMEARVIQHELDHLDGILFFERAIPETVEWVIGQGEDDDENAAPHE